MADFPIVASYKNIGKLFEAVQKAEVPQRFSYETLKRLGLTSSTDRGLVALLKSLGFLGPSGEPLEPYRDLRGTEGWKQVLGTQIRETYRDLFSIDQNINTRDSDTIKSAISRVTGKDAKVVEKMAWLFAALVKQATFGPSALKASRPPETEKTNKSDLEPLNPIVKNEQSPGLSFAYNIQIHLPAVRDISVYNAIFRSLREHLLDE